MCRPADKILKCLGGGWLGAGEKFGCCPSPGQIHTHQKQHKRLIPQIKMAHHPTLAGQNMFAQDICLGLGASHEGFCLHLPKQNL